MSGAGRVRAGLAAWLVAMGPGCRFPTGPVGLDCTDADGDLYCAEGDCDDTDPMRHPGANEEVGDEVDGDCDGRELCFVDADGDGFRTDQVVDSRTVSCAEFGEAPATGPTGDCDDTNFLTHPGATEYVGDGIDSDCDDVEWCYEDADQDGYRSEVVISSEGDVDCWDFGEAPNTDPLDCNDKDFVLHVLRLAQLPDDFSAIENSSLSTWSYRYTSSLSVGSPYTILPLMTSYFKEDWEPSAPRMWGVAANQAPWIGANETTDVLDLCVPEVPVDLSWPPGAVALAPGRASKVAVAWRAEVDGTVDVSATFTDVALGNDGVLWTIEHGAVQLASGVLDGSGGSVSSGERSIDDLPVSAGDYLYFAVDPRGVGVDGCPDDVSCNDATVLEVTVALCSVN